MKNKYYCPYCKGELDVLDGWGTISYYCMECNMLISRKKILTEEDVKETIEKTKNLTNNARWKNKHLIFWKLLHQSEIIYIIYMYQNRT